MKCISGAIVVFSGCFLWSSAVFGDALTYIGKGNLGASQLATWGGVAVTLAGLVRLFKDSDQSCPNNN